MRSGVGVRGASRGPRSSSTCLRCRTSRRRCRASLRRGRRARRPSPPNQGGEGLCSCWGVGSCCREGVHSLWLCTGVGRGAWSYGVGRRGRGAGKDLERVFRRGQRRKAIDSSTASLKRENHQVDIYERAGTRMGQSRGVRRAEESREGELLGWGLGDGDEREVFI